MLLAPLAAPVVYFILLLVIVPLAPNEVMTNDQRGTNGGTDQPTNGVGIDNTTLNLLKRPIFRLKQPFLRWKTML